MTAAQKTAAPKGVRQRGLTYQEHTGMLHLLTKKAFGVARSARIRVEYEDIFQIMCIGFVRASKGFDPERGIKFTTYYGRACWNTFSNWMTKQMQSRGAFTEDLAGDIFAGKHQDEDDSPVDAVFACEDLNPEELLAQKQDIRERLRALPADSKRVVRELLRPTAAVRHAAIIRQMQTQGVVREHDIRLADIRQVHGISVSLMAKTTYQVRSRFESGAKRKAYVKAVVPALPPKSKPAPAPVTVYTGDQLKDMGYL